MNWNRNKFFAFRLALSQEHLQFFLDCNKLFKVSSKSPGKVSFFFFFITSIIWLCFWLPASLSSLCYAPDTQLAELSFLGSPTWQAGNIFCLLCEHAQLQEKVQSPKVICTFPTLLAITLLLLL